MWDTTVFLSFHFSMKTYLVLGCPPCYHVGVNWINKTASNLRSTSCECVYLVRHGYDKDGHTIRSAIAENPCSGINFHGNCWEQCYQCRIKLLGGPVPNADGGPCPLSLPSPYPCRIPNSLPFKVGFGTYRHNDDKCTHTDYITWLYLFK